MNRHPVDKLADIRAEIKRLQEEEIWLRHELEQPGADLEGDEYRLMWNSNHRADWTGRSLRNGTGAALDGLMSST